MAKRREPYVLDPAHLRELLRLEHEIQAADVRAAIARRRRQSMVDEGFIYVVEFTSGVVKVGKTTHPDSRLATHAKFARIHGGDIRQSWISEQHHGFSKTERILIEFCQQRGVPIFGKEYFGGVSFNHVRDYADLTVMVTQIDTSVERMLAGAAGDLDANAVEAYRRATSPPPVQA